MKKYFILWLVILLVGTFIILGCEAVTNDEEEYIEKDEESLGPFKEDERKSPIQDPFVEDDNIKEVEPPFN